MFFCIYQSPVTDPREGVFRKLNKKVLLREHKRHTTHHVANTPCAVLSPVDGGGGGLPHLWTGGIPIQDDRGLDRGTPCPQNPLSYPCQVGWDTPYPHWAGWVYPQVKAGWGTPWVKAGWGYPDPYGLTHKLKILPSPILRMRAVKNIQGRRPFKSWYITNEKFWIRH